jgi:hypothetical protein
LLFSSLKFNTNILPIIAGIAKFKSHIIVVIVKIVISFTPIKPNNQTAIEPLITQSKTEILGITDAIRYIEKSKFKEVK